MSTFTDLIARVRDQISESTVDDVFQTLESGAEAAVIDVRERDEYADGHLPGAEFIPRGLLDLRIEGVVSDKSRAVILYCSGGTRSALAARTLHELGYQNVESMAGGFVAWKQKGYPFEFPRLMTPEQQTRYSRHMVIPEVGEKGQQALLDAKVLLIGAGGLGSPVALYLAAAGVGTLGVVDDDIVDRSNLQRQVLHTDDRVGATKVASAELAIRALNPDVDVRTYSTRLQAENVLDIFQGYDVVVDGTDNFATRYLINDACVHLSLPNIHGSVYRFEGQATTFLPHQGPCYRCLFPEPPPPELAPSCQDAGVLGVLPGVIGLLQALEVVKLVIGVGQPLAGRLLAFDGLQTEFRELRFAADPDCVVCGANATFRGFEDYADFCSW